MKTIKQVMSELRADPVRYAKAKSGLEDDLTPLLRQAEKDMKACPECLGEKTVPIPDPVWPDQWIDVPCPKCVGG